MKKVSSIVWQFFDRLEENKRCVAVLCKLCDTEYKYFGNTTNLRAHLIKKHPIQWEFRQNNPEGQKTVDESNIRIYEDDESTNQSTISPRRGQTMKATKEKNVRYSLSIQNPDRGASGEEILPQIEIQRVDILTNEEGENDDDENTHHLIHQMHNAGSEEEWLEEDYVEFEPKRKRVSYGKKIKREVVSPTRRRPSTFITQSTPNTEKRERIIVDNSRKDEYSVFGEYIANKLRKFKAPRTRGNIQQLITTILWQAEYGMFDDPESVKRVLLCSVQNQDEEQAPIDMTDAQVEEMHIQEQEEQNQSSESMALGNLPIITTN